MTTERCCQREQVDETLQVVPRVCGSSAAVVTVQLYCASCAQSEVDRLMTVSLEVEWSQVVTGMSCGGGGGSRHQDQGRDDIKENCGRGVDMAGCLDDDCSPLSVVPRTAREEGKEGRDYQNLVPAGTEAVDGVLVSLPFWSADRSWCVRIMAVVCQRVKQQTLMAWCNTLGGAHSALGDSQLNHAAEAGSVSLKQLMLSTEMGDPVLASRSRIFMASSLLQLGHLRAAKKIIKKEFQFATTTAAGKSDFKLAVMCVSALNRYKVLLLEQQVACQGKQ